MGLTDKTRFLTGLSSEDSPLFAMLYDRCARSEKFGGPMFGDFLSMDQQSRLAQRQGSLPARNMTLFGGYEGAERRMPGFNARNRDFPICAIEISGKGLGALTHRDYLGALMGLGIERRKLGDISVSEDGAVVFAARDITEYILTTLSSVGKYPVQTRELPLDSIHIGDGKFQEITGTVASLRLDSVVSLFAGKGRSTAAELIKAGRVYVNGISTDRTDMKLLGGEVITVRGFGRATLEVGGLSKKERIFVTLKKYA